MPAASPTPELLCEACGYAIGEIDLDSSCPECGVSIASSLPAARTGLWFQNHPRGWRITVADVVLTPRRSFRHMRIGNNRDQPFLIRSLGINALLWAPGLTAAALLRQSEQAYLLLADFCFIAPVAMPFVAGGIFALTYFLTVVEGLGVRLATRRRGWRITRPIARSVCAYASCGWILGGVLHLMIVIALFLWNSATHQGQPSRLQAQPFWIPIALAAIPGLLAFETLVYIGIRQCRYANAPAITSPVIR
ncbi:MAG: hypothetical protein ACREJO_12105 [Phycisphaerales bacterium]